MVSLLWSVYWVNLRCGRERGPGGRRPSGPTPFHAVAYRLKKKGLRINPTRIQAPCSEYPCSKKGGGPDSNRPLTRRSAVFMDCRVYHFRHPPPKKVLYTVRLELTNIDMSPDLKSGCFPFRIAYEPIETGFEPVTLRLTVACSAG